MWFLSQKAWTDVADLSNVTSGSCETKCTLVTTTNWCCRPFDALWLIGCDNCAANTEISEWVHSHRAKRLLTKSRDVVKRRMKLFQFRKKKRKKLFNAPDCRPYGPTRRTKATGHYRNLLTLFSTLS